MVAVVHGISCLRHVESSGPGMEPVSSAMARGFFTTGLPGKSHIAFSMSGVVHCSLKLVGNIEKNLEKSHRNALCRVLKKEQGNKDFH